MPNPENEYKRGQPRRFQSGYELEDMMRGYLESCQPEKELRTANDGKEYEVTIKPETMPNVAGFCVYADMTYETFYQQKNYYPESFNKIQLMLETAVINSGRNSDNFRAFYMKNKFGYTDKVQQEISTPEPLKIQRIEKLSDEELLMLKGLTKKIEDE